MLRRTTDLEPFLGDASNLAGGHADEVVMPESEVEVEEILRECSAKKIPVTVAGAGTGLAGGRVPSGGVVLSMARMNSILEIDIQGRCATVEPGVILQTLENTLRERNLFYPPDPTERGGQLGGNVATNASGARTFKYGPTRNWIERLHLILSTGERLSLTRNQCIAQGHDLILHTDSGREHCLPLPHYKMPSTSKHAAGYYAHQGMDALDLFIGSEGTLGVVTQIEMRLLELPEDLFTGIVFFPNEESTLNFVDEVRTLSKQNHAVHGKKNSGIFFEARALEFVDRNALDFIRDKYPAIPAEAMGGAIWFEQEMNASRASVADLQETLISQWAEVIGRHTDLIDESWFGLTEKDHQRMRDFRHAVPSAAYEFISQHKMRKFGTDMAVPDNQFREMLGFYRSCIDASGLQNVTWGHIGNSHLHVNLLPENEEQVRKAQQIYDDSVTEALRFGGTASAEHGIGKMKKKYLRQMYGEKGIEEMNALRQILDPAGILGVGTMT